MHATLSIVLFLVASNADRPWEKVEEDDGITVWTRDVEGSSIREVRAETEVPVAAQRIWDVIRDVDQYIEFMPYVVEARILGGEGKSIRYEYQHIAPPIVSDRDYTLRIFLEERPEDGIMRRTWTATPDKGPPVKDDIVRITICDGSWTIKKLSEKKSLLSYYLFTDPGGALPSWIANMANKSSIPDLLTAVRNQSIDPKWRRDD